MSAATKAIQVVARGAQEALGFDTSSTMKGLQVFIADIRNCATKEQEEARIDKELAKIRLKFTSTKLISGYDKKKYVWKLLYTYMLGYEIDFGHFQAVELCSSAKFSEKTAGYLAISLLLADNADILRLVVNSIKHDMNSANEHVAALALNTVANIGGAEFADNLFADISKMLLSQSTATQGLSPYIKRKACICLLRLYRKDSDTLQPEVWRKKLVALFQDRDVGLLTSASGFMLGILEMGTFPVSEWSEILPAVAQCLANLVQGECPEHYEYYHVPAPWLQTKLLRILQFFPVQMFTGETLTRINVIVHNVLTKPAAQRTSPAASTLKKRGKADAERQNRSNAEQSVLFEGMNLMIHLEDRCDPESTRTAAALLGSFISSTDPNIRYLGLETMARLATNIGTHEHLERYKGLIMEKMHEPDISIRRQALNLLYALCRPENWQEIVDELLEILGSSDNLLQEELVLKIAILAEKNAPNFGWYVDVVFKMLESAPDSVGDDVWYRVVQVVTGFEDGLSEVEKSNLQRHAAGKSFQNLAPQGKVPHETLVKLGAYMIGEFGHLLPGSVTPKAKFEALQRHYARVSSVCKSIILLACVKLYGASPDALRQDVTAFLKDVQETQDVELQQRSCELLVLMQDEEMLDHVLFPMPQYAESVQQNNPLIRRLKFQHKSRAHTRAQLEEAAKSEGGVYKPGSAISGRTTPKEGGDSTKASESAALFPGLDRGGSGGPGRKGPGASSQPGNAAARPGRDGGSSESESGSEYSDDGSPPSSGSTPAAGQDPRDLWQQLGIMPQGRFFTSPTLVLELRHEYQGATGRITVMFVNSSRETISGIQVMLPEAQGLRMQPANAAPAQLGPGQQAPHMVQVQCLRPFLQPAKYLVEYRDSRGSPVQLPLMLPAIMTKFITPAEVQLAQFRSFFESLGGPLETQAVGQAKAPTNQWPNYLTKGFNMFMLPESTPTAAFAAGTLNTGTPDPAQPGRTMTVPVLVRLEHDPGRNMVRLTVRSQNAEVTGALSKILETYLINLASMNGTARP